MQFDPALKELLLRETGSPLGESLDEASAARRVAVVARLVDPGLPVPGLEPVARFGAVVTGRVRLGDLVAVRRDANVASLKASRLLGPSLRFSAPQVGAQRVHAPPLGLSGRGVVVGVLDWGVDFAHANFRNPDGSTRIERLWDQRGGAADASPRAFGYGREITRERIDGALRESDPYASLAYDPLDSDPLGHGTHGTHVLDIAAGNGRAPDSAPGLAPAADIVFVHLRGGDTGALDTLGDSVRLLEAVRYVADCAGERPFVINLSLGQHGGPHDGSTLVERGLDALLAEAPGRAIVMSTGNYRNAQVHCHGAVAQGERVDLRWTAAPRHDEIAEMEIWYPGADRLAVELIDPDGASLAMVRAGEERVVRRDGVIVATLYNRLQDPNNGDNQIELFLWPEAAVGVWTTRLVGEHVGVSGFDAWIERDDPLAQSRFLYEHAVPWRTTNTVCNGTRTIAVGAYDGRGTRGAILPFSSVGPTRDLRTKPDIAAPGGGIRAARSSRRVGGVRTRDEHTVQSGTSMAAPHVTGAVALMFEAALPRRLTIEETRRALLGSARSVEQELEDLPGSFGAGRLDVAAAVRAVRAGAAPPHAEAHAGAPLVRVARALRARLAQRVLAQP
jgi:subtilisin family serine protease